jgi:hypothetical protein
MQCFSYKFIFTIPDFSLFFLLYIFLYTYSFLSPYFFMLHHTSNCLVNLTTVLNVDRNLDSPCYNSKMVYSVLHPIYGTGIQKVSFSSCNCQGKCGFSSPRNFGFYFLFFLFVMLHDTMIGC